MFQFLADVANNNMSLMSAIEPLLKLLCLTIFGLLLAHPRLQIVPKATFMLLSRLVFALFLPCLIFTHLGQTITLNNITQWWFIPVNVFINTFIASLLGILVVIICRPSSEFTRLTILMTAFGNTGNLPLAIVGSVCHTKHSFFGPHCHKKGAAYISFAQWVSMILVYTIVYPLMEPRVESYETDEENVEINKHLLLPPTIVSFLAIIVGVIPQLNDFVFGNDAPLAFLTDSLEIIAGAMVPSVMLILGSMLAEGPNESKLGIRTMIGVIVARLLILPLLGIGIVTLADKMGFLVEGDEMYRFVLLLQYTTPSAILLGAIASLRGYAVSESSALLFWQHLFALASLSLYLVTYFKLLSFV